MEEDDFISKTQRKKQSHALQSLGEQLVALTEAKLMQVPLTESEMAHPVIRTGIDDYGLKKQIHKLKDEQRLLIDLSYFQGYTHEQIAQALHIPLGTVKTRIRSALTQLRALLS